MAVTEVYCLACGIDISSANGNRLLQTEKSRVVVPLWSDLCSEELENRGLFHEELVILDLVYKHNGKMCRKCFSTFNRCVNLIKKLKGPLSKALDIVQNNGSLCLIENMEAQDNEMPCTCDNGNCQNTPSCSRLSSPVPKRLCLEPVGVASECGESPAVMVCGLHIIIMLMISGYFELYTYLYVASTV